MKERGLLETAFVTGRTYFWVGDFSTGNVGNIQPALTDKTLAVEFASRCPSSDNRSSPTSEIILPTQDSEKQLWGVAELLPCRYRRILSRKLRDFL